MDRRQFMQASSALALGCSPLSRAFSQTSWTPPYALPVAGQVIVLGGGNTLDSVATAANGWGNHSSTVRATPIYNGYGFGAFSADYSTAGAMVIAGIGGHHAGGIWGGFIFDFTTGRWTSKANANGKVETLDDPSVDAVDWSTGELQDKTGLTGQLPIPGHGYLWHFSPPKAISGGTKGYLIKGCVAAGSDAGWDAARSFKLDLDTGAWTYASDNNINFDGAYLNPYTDGGGDWDPVTNRFYTPQHGAYTDELRYLENTATGWTWRKTYCPNLRNAALMTVFVEKRDLVLGYRDGAWQKVNLDNPGAGASAINMVNGGLLSGFYSRFHRYPADGCWYTLRGKANRAAISTWPNDGSPSTTLAADQFLLKIDPATWTVSQEAISGGILALLETVWTDTPPHGNAFVYVPALQCFAWFPRHDVPPQLIKPKGAGTPVADTQPPTVPTNLRVTGTTASSIGWAWNASTDNGGGAVAGYNATLYNAADAPIATSDVGNTLSYTANGLAATTTYKLRVSAYDNASTRNESAACTPVAATTAAPPPTADTQPPTVPTGLTVNGTPTSSSITWTWNPSTDNGGGTVAGYKVTLLGSGGTPVGGTPLDIGNVTSYTATGLTAATTYTLSVSAYDNASTRNESAACAPVAGTTAAPPPTADTQPPTVPGTLRVTSSTTSTISWAWYASTDNGGGSVKGYKVVLYDDNGTKIDGPRDVGNVLSYTAAGLAANTSYKLSVQAYDNAPTPNESALTAPVQGKTRKKDVPGKGN